MSKRKRTKKHKLKSVVTNFNIRNTGFVALLLLAIAGLLLAINLGRASEWLTICAFIVMVVFVVLQLFQYHMEAIFERVKSFKKARKRSRQIKYQKKRFNKKWKK